MGAVGALAALVVFLRRERELGVSSATEDKLTGALVAAGVLWVFPANLANWFFMPELMRLPMLHRFAEGGYTFYYGMFGFFAVFTAVLKIRGLDAAFWRGEIVPSVLIFHAFGRVGCSLAGCCHGRFFASPARFPWGSIEMFPAREIESLFLFALFFVFRFKVRSDRFRLYLLCYSVLRFFLEFGRGDYRGRLFVEFLSPAQVTSAAVWVCLAVSYAIDARRRAACQ